MKNKFFFLFQALIIYNGYIFIHAIMGPNIRCARRNEFPSVVALVELNQSRSTQDNIFCTGVFITKSHILTYEQCFEYIENRNFKVIAGHPNVLQGSHFYIWWWTTYERWADLIGVHQIFHDNDVAMLRIRGTPLIRIIPSAITSITPLNRFFGRQLQIVGFGRDNNNPTSQILKMADVEVLSNDRCAAQLNELSGRNLTINQRYICTGRFIPTDPYALLSEGDSGGPLYFEGTLVAINTMMMSDVVGVDHPRRVNLHITLEWYRNFINFNLRF